VSVALKERGVCGGGGGDGGGPVGAGQVAPHVGLAHVHVHGLLEENLGRRGRCKIVLQLQELKPTLGKN
jgi:hypothetical protein